MSRAFHAAALHAPHPPQAFAASVRGLDWSGAEPALARILGAIGECACAAWWDGSAFGLHLNGLLGLFEAEAPASRRKRA